MEAADPCQRRQEATASAFDCLSSGPALFIACRIEQDSGHSRPTQLRTILTVFPNKAETPHPAFSNQGYTCIYYMPYEDTVSIIGFAGTQLVAIYRTRVYGLTSLGWLLSAWAENVFLGLRSYCDGTADRDIWPASDEHSTIT